MTEVAPVQTSPQVPSGTSGEPAAPVAPAVPEATPTDKGSGEATPVDKKVELSEKDYKKLVSERDKANGQRDFINQIAQERFTDDFLKDNADKYPDLTREDLSHVWGDEAEFHAEAARIQDRLQKHAQAKLLDIENPTPHRESPEDRTAREAELAKTGGRDALAKVFAGRMQRNN